MKGVVIQLPEEYVNEMVSNNDPRLIKPGSTVKKIDEDSSGDVTKIGSRGTVIGGMYFDDPKVAAVYMAVEERFRGAKAIYIVQFEGTPFPTMTIDLKIKEVIG